jgi:hypothetical protein
MGLEILATTYVLTEKQTEKIPDIPLIGELESKDIYTIKWGTYFFKRRAERRAESLKREKRKEGWEQSQHYTEKNHLYKGKRDIYYSIEKVSHKII